MAYKRLTDDLNVIQKLDTEPNDIGGLSADELKAKFDEAVNIVKTYINEVLLPAMEGNEGANNVGIETISAISTATNVQDALIQIVQLIQGVSQGSVPDGSITSQKLADAAVTAAKMAENAVDSPNISDNAITSAKLAALCVTIDKLAAKCVTSSKIADNAVGTEQLANSSVTNGKLASDAVQTSNIYEKAVSASKLADAAVTGAKIANANVTRAKLANDALYSPVAEVSDTTYNVVETDIGKTIKCTNTSGCTITISNSVFAALPVGAEIAVLSWIHNNTDHVTITLGSSYYMNKPGKAAVKGGSVITNTRYGMVALKKITPVSLLATGSID